MKNAFLIEQNAEVGLIGLELNRQPQLWNQDNERIRAADSPHRDSDDIWIRYNDKTPFLAKGDFSHFNDPHFPVWYPAYYDLPSINPFIWRLMAAVRGEHLGGVLIWRVRPGMRIYPHIDTGWHVDFYDKFNVIISGAPGAGFVWADDQEAMPARTGDVYHFFNNTPHEVINDSDQDFIALVVCIRTHHFAARYQR